LVDPASRPSFTQFKNSLLELSRALSDDATAPTVKFSRTSLTAQPIFATLGRSTQLTMPSQPCAQHAQIVHDSPVDFAESSRSSDQISDHRIGAQAVATEPIPATHAPIPTANTSGASTIVAAVPSQPRATLGDLRGLWFAASADTVSGLQAHTPNILAERQKANTLPTDLFGALGWDAPSHEQAALNHTMTATIPGFLLDMAGADSQTSGARAPPRTNSPSKVSEYSQENTMSDARVANAPRNTVSTQALTMPFNRQNLAAIQAYFQRSDRPAVSEPPVSQPPLQNTSSQDMSQVDDQTYISVPRSRATLPRPDRPARLSYDSHLQPPQLSDARF
jgi:hypothetical protein